MAAEFFCLTSNYHPAKDSTKNVGFPGIPGSALVKSVSFQGTFYDLPIDSCEFHQTREHRVRMTPAEGLVSSVDIAIARRNSDG